MKQQETFDQYLKWARNQGMKANSSKALKQYYETVIQRSESI